MTTEDQAGKRRKSSTDALGRLTQVIENPDASPAYAAAYTYDVLDNLTDVLHGGKAERDSLNCAVFSGPYSANNEY